MSDVLGLLGLGLLENLSRAFETRFGPRDERIDEGNDGSTPAWKHSPAAPLMARGLRLLDDGDARSALCAFEAAAAEDPSCGEVQLAAACALDAMGKPKAAADRLASRLHGERPDPLTLFALGYCRERAGLTELAMEAYAHTTAVCPQLCNAHERLAAIHLMRGAYDRATHHCETIYRGDPNRADIRRALAAMKLLAGAPADAMDQYQLALTIDPDNWSAECDDVDELIAGGKLDAAILLLEERAESQPGFPDTYLRLGELYASLNHHDEAIDNYCRAVELHPDYLEASSKLAAHLLRVGRREQAAKWFAHGTEINDRLLGSYTGLGVAQYRLGRHDQAQASLQTAVRIAPNTTLLFSEVARIRSELAAHRSARPSDYETFGPSAAMSREDSKKAWLARMIDTYRRLLATRSNHAQWHYQLGLLLRLRGDLEGAVEHYHNAVRINPAYTRAWTKLALVLHETQRIPEAIEALERGLNAGPDLHQLHYQLAIIFTMPVRFEVTLDQMEQQLDSVSPVADVRANIQLALENLGLLDPISAGLLSTPPATEADVLEPYDCS